MGSARHRASHGPNLMNVTLIPSLSVALTSRSFYGQSGTLPVRCFRSAPAEHPVRRALQRVNIALREHTQNDPQRRELAGLIFDRPGLKSTYDLTVADLIAFLKLAYPDQHTLDMDPEFEDSLELAAEEIVNAF